MNKQILKLMNEATIQEGSHGAFGEPTINEWVDLEKFAELIVQDCLAVIKQRQDLGVEKLCQDECTALLAEIKHRFGVE